MTRRWTLTLVPRDASVAKAVASIRIDGVGKQSRCMHMQEADGDLAIDLLGPLAVKMPASPPARAAGAVPGQLNMRRGARATCW